MTRSTHWCAAIALFATWLSSAAWADQSGSATLAANASLNLDTGAVSATGDIVWSGTALVPVGRAGLANAGKLSSRTFKSIPARSASSAAYGSAPILAGKLVVGDVFGVHTNGGHYSKVRVTAIDGKSLSLEYTTFSAAAAGSGTSGTVPVISKLQNNYSFILPGLPNYGIAPGSLFIILGTSLSIDQQPTLQSSAAGLPKLLNQTSVSVTVNGITTNPALYYTSATAVGAVLPSTTPVGNGTITVTYNGQPSAPAPIHVVASAVGLDTLYGTGSGAAVATDINFNYLLLTNSATPGQPVILWGTGVGADTANGDTTSPQSQDNLTNVPMQIYVGGISADVLYHGRSQYPGLDEIDFYIPPNVSLGCFVSVVVQTGTITSNTVTIPVSPNGGACSDPATGLNGTQLQSLAAKGSPVNGVVMAVNQETVPGNTSAQALALFISAVNAEFGAGYYYASQGSCIVVEPGFPPEDLGGFSLPDAGTIQLTGPSVNEPLTLDQSYFGPLASINTGTYTFAGSGGPDVGSFTSSVAVQTPFNWTNQAGLASITRSQDAKITWSGGSVSGDVMIQGIAPSQAGNVTFYCHAPAAAGQFTIPSSILMAMPPVSGKLLVANVATPQSVSASGLDLGFSTGIVSIVIQPTFK